MTTGRIEMQSNKLESNGLNNLTNNRMIFVVIMCLCFLNLATPINYVIYLIIVLLFLKSDTRTSIIIYMTLLPWERILTVPGIGSLLSILQIIYFVKLILQRQALTIRTRDTLLFGYLMIIGFVSLCRFESVSGLMFCLEFLFIITVANELFLLEKDRLALVGFGYSATSLLVSLGFATIHGNFARRWVDGIGYVPLFRGVLESNETAFYCALVLFLLCILDYKLSKKITYMTLISIALFATVSMTGMILALFSISYSVVFNLIKIRKNGELVSISRPKKIVLIIMVVVFIIVLLQFGIGGAVLQRIENVISNFQMGDLNKATSGRNDLAQIYMTVFDGLPVLNKMFGTGATGRNYLIELGHTVQYPHNSFIELLFYGGYVGIILILAFIVLRIVETFKRDKEAGKILLAIKIITIIEGFSVTMSGYGYWMFWLLI